MWIYFLALQEARDGPVVIWLLNLIQGLKQH